MAKRGEIVNGCTYEVMVGGVKKLVRVLGHNPIDGLHTVSLGGKTVRMDLVKASVRRRRTSKTKASTDDVYLYLCDIGNGYFKVGASSSPQRRRKQIKTYSSKATMRAVARIPTNKSRDFKSFEKKVLARFAHGRTRGGTEVLRLNQSEAADCAGFMRSICARA